jgi:hypothetical protein
MEHTVIQDSIKNNAVIDQRNETIRMSKTHWKRPITKKDDFFYGRWLQIWDKSINHTSSNAVNCKINDINVNKDILTHTHNFTVKLTLNKNF